MGSMRWVLISVATVLAAGDVAAQIAPIGTTSPFATPSDRTGGLERALAPASAAQAPLAATPDSRQAPGYGGPFTVPGSRLPQSPADTVRGEPLRPNPSIRIFGTVTGSVTDNAFLTTENRETDFYATLSPGFSIQNESARSRIDLNYTANADIYALNSELDSLRHNLRANGFGILVPDTLAIVGNAFATPVTADRLGRVSASDRSIPSGRGNGLTDTFGYQIGPVLRNRIANYVVSELSYLNSGTFFSDPVGGGILQNGSTFDRLSPARDTITHTINERLTSGPYFARLNWLVDLTYQDSSRTGSNIISRTASFQPSYALTREIALLGTLGYDDIETDEQLTRRISSPVFLGGLRFTPSPYLSAQFQAGYRYDRPNFNGDLRYQLGAFTALVASYSDRVETDQGRIFDSLGNVVSLPNGQFVDTRTGLLFTPQQLDELSLSNAVSRYRQFTATLSVSRLRTSYGVTAFLTDRDTLSTGGGSTLLSSTLLRGQQQTVTGGTAFLSHAFTPLLTGSASATYSVSDTERLGGLGDETFRFNTSLAYLLNDRTRAFITYAYLDRTRDNSTLVSLDPLSGDLTENVISIGLRRDF